MPDLPAQLAAALAGRYAIERELGRGGNATVYLAHDRKHNRKVALKVLLPELAQSVRTERFVREIEIAAHLAHPHILAIYDSGEAGACLYYVMPYVEGESLRDRLARDKQLPLSDALQIAREVADALSYAHRRDVVHRDIKPENILLQEGHAVVADFGIARALSEAGGQSVTATGIAVGTPLYMSPEQGGGSKTLDGRSDVYSLACVVYEMLAGRPPFTGESAQEILAHHALDPVPRLRKLRPEVPAALEDVILHALAKRPAERLATAAAFAAALAQPGAGRRGSVRRWLRRASREGRVRLYGGLIFALLLAGSAVVSRRLRTVPVATPPEKSIAVLPFVNLSADSTQEYFSEGMAEELINAFSRIAGLRVPGRTSSFAFKGKSVPYSQIGAALKVATVLEGSVRRSGDRLRVSARLVNVADGYQLWTEMYERKVTDVFAVQDEIAHAIVQALQVKLAATPAPARPENFAAYQFYLQGRFFWNKGTADGFSRALDLFTAAIAQDSGYARAWAGLADSYGGLELTASLPPAEARPKARAAAERAVALDSQLAEAYTSRGRIRHRWEWDWAGAEQDFGRAVALNPGYALGHLWYGDFLVQQGRFPEGLREARRAAELDPLSAQVQSTYSFELFNARHYGPAMEQARKALELEPTSATAHQRLGEAYLLQDRFAEAIREFQAGRLGGGRRAAGNLGGLGYAYARAGRRHEALQILEELKARAVQGDRVLVGYQDFLATLYAGLGDKDQAFAWLERAYQEHEFGLTKLRVNPLYDPLRSDPRFTQLLRKVGLEP